MNRFNLHYSRKPADAQKKDVPYKKPNLNHTEYAYREAVNRLKSMLTDTYSACKLNGRRHGYESEDTDNVSVSIMSYQSLAKKQKQILFFFFLLKLNDEKVIERPVLSEISKYIPPTGVSRYSSTQRYYNPNPVCVAEPQQPTVLKTTDSVNNLHPASSYVAPLTTVAVPQPNNELLQFIEKQEGYIEQLERESHFCRVNCYC